MKTFPKLSVLLAIVILIFDARTSNAQTKSSQSELRVGLRDLPNGAHPPRFAVELQNIGDHDLILRLGMMFGNGRQQFADAIHLSLRASGNNNVETLELKDPPYVAGRIDPFVVPLPKRASIVLPINLADYWIPKEKIFEIQIRPGRYHLRAEYRGEGIKRTNLDMHGILTMPFWLGWVTSNEVSFVIPEK